MTEVPEFWRTEIWHPISVHLPLAILLLGTGLLIAGFLSKRLFLENTGKLLLPLGALGAWLAVYTGDLADSVVSRKICDPTVLGTHENNAYMVAWIFSVTSLIIILEYFGILKSVKRFIKISVIALSIAGSGFLIYTGHLGAKLVYQQAAGVYTPSDDCEEFVDY